MNILSNTAMSLIIKFVLTFAAAWLAFGMIEGNPLTYIFILALLGTALNYVLGDLFVLPNFGNIVASIGDGAVAAVTALIFSTLVMNFRTNGASLATFFVIVALAEYLFHMFLKNSDTVAP